MISLIFPFVIFAYPAFHCPRQLCTITEHEHHLAVAENLHIINCCLPDMIVKFRERLLMLFKFPKKPSNLHTFCRTRGDSRTEFMTAGLERVIFRYIIVIFFIVIALLCL